MNRPSWYSVFHAKEGDIEDAGGSQKRSTIPSLEVEGNSFWNENFSQHSPRSIPVMMLSTSA